jgi:hypothetical protein
MGLEKNYRVDKSHNGIADQPTFSKSQTYDHGMRDEHQSKASLYIATIESRMECSFQTLWK